MPRRYAPRSRKDTDVVLDRAGRAVAARATVRRLDSAAAGLAVFRTVEHYPYAEIAGEFLEAVRRVRRGKEKITRPTGSPGSTVEEHTVALCHNVKLVARVRRLQVSAAGRVVLHQQGSVAKQRKRARCRGIRDPRGRGRHRDMRAAAGGNVVAHGRACISRMVALLECRRSSIDSGESHTTVLR